MNSKARFFLGVAVFVVSLLVLWLNPDENDDGETTASSAPSRVQAEPQGGDRSRTIYVTKRGSHLVAEIEDQVVKDWGKEIYRGTIHLRETLERIDHGRPLPPRHAHDNDGSTFGNREKRLPKKPRGHYREFVHPTKQLSGPGPQRIVRSKDDVWYYTPDHYETFERLNLEQTR